MCGMCDHAAQSIHNALMYLIADFPNVYIIMTSNHACVYRMHYNYTGSGSGCSRDTDSVGESRNKQSNSKEQHHTGGESSSFDC
jgi:hypothetical protein